LKNNKNTIVSVHQPNFLPWIGYFYKIAKSDIFVYLDNVQFIKRSFINRVKIKTITGTNWMTVPVKTKRRYLQSINETKIDNETDWRKKFLGIIKANYSKSPYFKKYFKSLELYFSNDFNYLTNFNMGLTEWVLSELSIKTKILKSSEIINDMDNPTERIVIICKKLNADAYLSGFGGEKYQERDKFENQNINLIVYDFNHPVYEQLWGDFIPGLSILDYMFNTDIKEMKEFFNEIQ